MKAGISACVVHWCIPVVQNNAGHILYLIKYTMSQIVSCPIIFCTTKKKNIAH